MTITTPTTELEAVNTILGAIGESPINSVTNLTLGDAAKAYDILTRVSREVQSSGWKFNTDYEYPITPDTDGFINIPLNAASVAVSPIDAGMWDLAWRGGKMYDRKNQTFVIGKTVRFNMVTILTFEDMPPTARHYITIRSARIFLDEAMGSSDLNGFKEKDEAQAQAIFAEKEAEDEDYNILYGSWDVFRTIDRRNSINNLILRR